MSVALSVRTQVVRVSFVDTPLVLAVKGARDTLEWSPCAIFLPPFDA